MREIIISSTDSGQRFDKLLFKYLDKAPASFIYKMLRKKNITLNGKKATGKELLSENDSIKIFISEDSLQNFKTIRQSSEKEVICPKDKYFEPDIIFEDDNIIIVLKPVGILSQKAQPSDISINEICISYLQKKRDPSIIDTDKFRPSVCNRLDRNTEGLVIFAKTYVAANKIADALKNRTIHKYYYCIVEGVITKDISIDGYLAKDESNNTVSISDVQTEGSSCIKTGIHPVKVCNNKTLLEIELITGKTHQIRSHLAYIGHPIIGDYKYGHRRTNDRYKALFGLDHQLLLSYKIVMPEFTDDLSDLSSKIFLLRLPSIYEDILNVNLEDTRA